MHLLLLLALAQPDEAIALRCREATRADMSAVIESINAAKEKRTRSRCAWRLARDIDAAPARAAAEALVRHARETGDYSAIDKATEKGLSHEVAPFVVDALLPELKKARPRSRLADVFAWAGDPRAADPLAEVYERVHGSAWIGAYAASINTRADLERLLSWREKARYYLPNAISGIRHPELAPALTPLLRDDDSNVRAATARALGRLAVPDTAVALLDAATRDENSRVRGVAAEALAYVASEESLDRMTKLMKDRNHTRRLAPALVRTSRVFGHKHTRKALRGDNYTAYAILNAFIRDVHPSDEGVLLNQTTKKDFSRRQLSVIALGDLHTKRTRKALCRILKKDRRLRSTAARSLAQFRDLEAIDCLIAQLAKSTKRREPSTHQDLHRALRHASGEDLKTLADWRAWRKRGRPGKSTVDDWIGSLDDESGQVRALAAHQIARRLKKVRRRELDAFRDKTVPALVASLEDERNDAALQSLAETLGLLNDPRAADPLVAALAHAPERAARRAIIAALDGLGDGRGTLHLVRELEAHDPGTRQRAAEDLSLVTDEPLHYDIARWRTWWKKHAERYRR